MTAEDLARRQAELLAAVLHDGAPPAGFTAAELTVQAGLLRAKRRRAVEKVRPDLAAALGDRFDVRFDAFAAARPKSSGTTSKQDAAAFEHWLRERGELPAERRGWWRRSR